MNITSKLLINIVVLCVIYIVVMNILIFPVS